MYPQLTHSRTDRTTDRRPAMRSARRLRSTRRNGPKRRQRFDALAQLYRPSTLDLLRRIGIRDGWRCVDVGCGSGHVSIDMAKLVAPSGSVVAIDCDAMVLDLARKDASTARVSNLEFRCADAQTLGRGPYDLVYARFLLAHLADPQALVSHLATTLKPGGVLAVEDIDFQGAFSYPFDIAHERFFRIYRETVHRRGGDADIGPRLPGLLRTAGLADVGVNVVVCAFIEGAAKFFHRLTLERIRAAAIGERVASAADIDQVTTAMHAFAAHRDTIVGHPRVFQVWGCRTP
jgi:2-polyprenyl-3-methyl-5-hydroxy-6-metoxy-1,4-benzoquinol methylase